MKLLHTADLHIGKVVNGFSMIEDQRHILESLLALAQKQHVDALLLAGDVYDKSAPSAEAVSLLDWFFEQIIDAGIPCVLTPGNHDSAERLAYAAGALSKQGIHIPPLYNGTVSKVSFEDDYGTVDIWPVPFLKPAHVRPYFPDEEIGTDYTAALAAALSACDVDPAHRNVAVCHQFVVSGGQDPLRCDSELSVGGLDAVDAEVFKAFDYVALGHLHQAQSIGRETVRYAGSPLKYSASETLHVKSATLVTLGARNDDGSCELTLEALPLVPLRDMRRIKGPFAELIDPSCVSQGNPEDYLHVTLTDKTPIIDALSRLRAPYPNVMSLEYLPADGSGTHSETPVAQEQIDPLELFERFYEEQTGDSLTKEQTRMVGEVLSTCAEDRREPDANSKGKDAK